MLKNKIVSIFVLFLVLFMIACAVSAANDANNTLKSSNDIRAKESTLNTNLENKDVENNGGTVNNDGESNSIDTSFTQLVEDIKNSGGVLNLTHDYAYDPTKDKSYKNGIKINSDLIINGNNHVIDGSNTARALYINSSLTLTINNLTITNCLSNRYEGGAIYNDYGSLNVTGSSFINCSSSGSGGAIYNNGNLNVIGSSFINCTVEYKLVIIPISEYGGAIYNYMGGSLNVNGSSFINCSSPSGGAIYNYYGSLIVTGSSFINCSSSNGSGAIYNYYGSLIVTGSSFINCSSSGYGGAIDNKGSLNVTGSIFDNCNSSNGIIYIRNRNYDLNGNYWCMNCATVDEFKAANLIIEDTSSVAPDNWIVMNITNSNEIVADKDNAFSATLNTLQDGTDYSGNLPDYETIITDETTNNPIKVNIVNGVGSFNYAPVSAGNFSLVASSLNSGNVLINSTFTAFNL